MFILRKIKTLSLVAVLLSASILSTLTALPSFALANDAWFNPYLTTSGEFIVRGFRPTTLEEYYIISELPYIDTGITMTDCNEDYSECLFEHKVWNQDSMTFTDVHSERFSVFYTADESVKASVDSLMSSANLEENNHFHLYDIELLNYWASQKYDNASDSLTYKVPLPNFSSELRAALSNSNFDFYIDQRAGCAEPLLTCQAGIGKVAYSETLYYSIPFIEVLSENIFYVPNDTADNNLAKALETRINNLYGEGTVEVVSTNKTVAGLGVTETDLEYLDHLTSLSEPIFSLTIFTDEEENNTHEILIRKDSSKMFTPSLNTTDVSTGINISSDAPNLPVDTRAYAMEIGNEGFDEAEEALGTKDFYGYELGIYSELAETEFSAVDGFDFTVKIPVPENLKSKTLLSAYWLNYGTGEVEEYYAEVKNGYAIFDTTHFSTYILAESSSDRATEVEEVVIPKAPNTGRK